MGTKFRVYLPANPAEAAAKKLELAPAHFPRGAGKLVLLVDDDDAIRRVAKSTLERFDYRVLAARNGAEAMGLYAQHRTEVAVVLTDMAMPIMDGPALVFALKSMNQRVRIIGSSGLAGHRLATQALKVGVQLFLPKPYTTEMLLQALQQVYHC